jgi:uncharacterized protein YjbI with pentapeptide repeats
MMREETVRERTVERFEQCERIRAKALEAALETGKSKNEARQIAHEAAQKHWNDWADDMLDKRKALEERGAWAAEKSVITGLEPKNAETRAWMEEAKARFSGCHFLLKRAEGIEEALGDCKKGVETESPPIKWILIERGVSDFRGFIFPGVALFDNVTFSGEALFENTTFSGDASFASANFSGGAVFATATFSGKALFENTTFSGNAVFASTIFSGDTSFDRAIFSKVALFASATFSGDALFNSATFSGAVFATATFSGASASFVGVALFNGATFTKGTSFGDAKFGTEEKQTDASFTDIKVERRFDLTGAYFSKLPSFCQTDFKQAPDLDGVRFPLPAALGGDPTLIPKYRAIRRMAIQGADYESEYKAFKGELRSRRWRIDKWWHPSAWLGVLYDGIADCPQGWRWSPVRHFFPYLSRVGAARALVNLPARRFRRRSFRIRNEGESVR